MAIIIKTADEIQRMRALGKRHANILSKLATMVRPGISTWELDQYAEQLVRDGGDIPAFKGYRPAGMRKKFPATLCTSVNAEIVHGIPDKKVILKQGDVISIDLGLFDGHVYTDAAVTVPVGTVDKKILDMIATANESLLAGISAVEPGNMTGDIGHAVETVIGRKYGIVDGFAGHGVGRHIHEDPFIPNYGDAGTGDRLVPGMTIAIEPMLTLGKPTWDILTDEYTVVTRDHSIAVHVEHTVLVTETGYEILTVE